MIDADNLAQSKAIQQRTGRTFHLATRLLPSRIRNATYVLYAFFRIADDVVDDPDPPPAERQLAELERIRDAALGNRPADDPVLAAFRTVSERYEIPDREVNEFVDAMATDVSNTRYETHEELAEYLRGSSVAVANMMLCVMDPEDADTARPHARALAEALQLTNFLRDVREDVVDYGRIYLPQSRLAEYDVSEEQVERLAFSPEFAVLMRAELARTERRYRAGIDGVRYLPEGCQFAVLLAGVLYVDHHRLIRAQGYDVLTSRPSLATSRRLLLAAKTWWHWRRTEDPRAAFEAASSIPPRNDGRWDEDGTEDDVIVDSPGSTNGGGGTRSIGDVVSWVQTRLFSGESK
ncbi:phytoene/squalene synthase family protein [Halovivax cerinus]|uniref:Phytoene/squalene synthase family protein n=1 Tax=Halovivax cerinus TaxID=1487865 RepID=A0ABD5NJX3_9EURY|nr:phytoene/squalene synthase family protein [Halovivax cerinus]